MRKQDILKAEGHLGEVAIFEWERRGTTRFVRLLTEEEKKAPTDKYRRYQRSQNANRAVSVIEVEAFDHKGNAHDGYSEGFIGLGKRDKYRRFYAPGVGMKDSTEIAEHESVVTSQILRQVNADKSFVQFYQEFSDAQIERRKQQAQREQAARDAQKADQESVKELRTRIRTILGTDDPSVSYDYHDGDAKIDIESLVALVQLAEKAKN
jgi:hypothetical protein